MCCCDGRVVKALDSKSNGIFPRRFESCSQRVYFLLFTQSLTSLRQSFNTYDERDFCSIPEKDAVNAAFF